MSTKKVLTGNYRHTVEPRGFVSKKYVLVLEVEVHEKGYVEHHDDLGGRIETDRRDVDTTYWRAARVEDMEHINWKGKPKDSG